MEEVILAIITGNKTVFFFSVVELYFAFVHINMDKGKVKFYNREKKYGFITGDDGKDYFFHISGVSGEAELNDEDAVEFKVADGERGPKAVDISPL